MSEKDPLTGAELRAWRREAGLSTWALASRLGVARETVARWEFGQRRMMAPGVIRAALRAIDAELLEDVDWQATQARQRERAETRSGRPALVKGLTRAPSGGTDLAREIGQQLATTRRLLGLGQEELAQAVHTRGMQVSRWERGVSLPKAHFRARLRRLLAGQVVAQRLAGVSLDALRRFLRTA